MSRAILVAMEAGDGHGTTGSVQTALVAGGCFWCVEADVRKLPGVISAMSGYAGGTTTQPTYETYATGGHREVVLVEYDSARLSFRELIIYVLKHIDPTDEEGSFADRGMGYAPALYYDDEAEKTVIEQVVKEINALHVYKKPLAVPMLPRPTFWPAEAYHQGYAQGVSGVQYRLYRTASGRDQFIRVHWADDTGQTLPGVAEGAAREVGDWRSFTKPAPAVLRERLTEIQYNVTQADGTEPAYKNEYWDNYEPGIYVDVVSGEPLFLSIHKFDSGTGWPSFTQPIAPDTVVTHTDKTIWQTRTEVRSAIADSHLGHVFPDGPDTAGGLRYCMNSAALRFIPAADMDETGYGVYRAMVSK